MQRSCKDLEAGVEGAVAEWSSTSQSVSATDSEESFVFLITVCPSQDFFYNEDRIVLNLILSV